ncbi:hypothetical protein [Streptomyces sp. 372A]
MSAFVDAVQALVRHPETGGGRDALPGEQVADVRRARRLRPHHQPGRSGGVEEGGGGLFVLGETERRPGSDPG